MRVFPFPLYRKYSTDTGLEGVGSQADAQGPYRHPGAFYLFSPRGSGPAVLFLFESFPCIHERC